MSIRWPAKDPDERLDFGLDWTKEMARVGDTISESSWDVTSGDGGLLIEDAAGVISGMVTSVWLTGGTVGETYTVTNRMTTTAGRIYERSATLRVRHR